MNPYAGGYAHPYGAPPPPHHPYGQQQQYGGPAAYPHPAAAAAAATPSAYPPAHAYYQPPPQAHAAYGVAPAVPYGTAPVGVAGAGMAPAGLSIDASAVDAAPAAAPLSPISQMRAREAAMAAFNLAQAALPPPPTAAPVQSAATGTATAAAGAEEPEERDPNEIEMKLENAHYNLNEVLGANLIAHPYYRDLSKFTTVDEVVDEIYAEVKNVEPMVAGKDRLPSTAFFLLYKLFELRLTKRQMHVLLRHKDSPYIRALGFLYLRCVVDPKSLWGWFEPYLCDPAVFVPGQQDPTPKTMGAFVRELLEKNDYYSMKLRRIPIPVHRDYQLKLLALDARIKRAERNEPYRARIVKGTRVQAEYYDDCKFYDAVVDRVEEGPGGKFLVTYIEYGQSEELDIGSLKLPPAITDAEPMQSARERGAPKDAEIGTQRGSSRDVSRDRESERRRDRGSRSRDRSRDRDRDRDRKRSRSHDRRRSRSRSRDRRHRRSRDRSRSHDRKRRSSRSPSSGGSRDVFSSLPSSSGARGSYHSSSSSSRARARSPSPEVSLEALRRKEREDAVAQGKDYARRPSSYKNSLSMSLISGTARRRSRTPPVRRAESHASLSVIEEAPRKSGLSEEAKAQRAALLAKYGDAGSHKDKAAQRNKSNNNNDDDIIRLGL